MAFIPVPDTVKAVFSLYGSAEGFASVGLYFEKAGFTEADMIALGDHLAANFAVDLMAELDASIELQYISLYDLGAVDGLKVVKDTAIFGSQAGTLLTGGLSCVVSFNANKRGKWNAGRNYVPGMNETTVVVDSIIAGTMSNLKAAYETLITAPPTGWNWVIVSRYLNGVARQVGVTGEVATVRVRSPKVGFQRRRVDRG